MVNIKLNRIINQNGLTLMELIVSMGLVSLLILMLVTGNIFVQKVIGQWSSGNRLYEEGEWVLGRLIDLTRTCDSLDSGWESNQVVFYFGPDSVNCIIENEALLIGGRVSHQRQVKAGELKIEKWPSTNQRNGYIFDNEETFASSLYQIEIKLSYRGQSDVFQAVTRNSKASFQNHR